MSNSKKLAKAGDFKGYSLSGARWADIGSPPEFLALNR
jgi:NDP-sugar pyrophosphorylase family protein